MRREGEGRGGSFAALERREDTDEKEPHQKGGEGVAGRPLQPSKGCRTRSRWLSRSPLQRAGTRGHVVDAASWVREGEGENKRLRDWNSEINTHNDDGDREMVQGWC